MTLMFPCDPVQALATCDHQLQGNSHNGKMPREGKVGFSGYGLTSCTSMGRNHIESPVSFPRR